MHEVGHLPLPDIDNPPPQLTLEVRKVVVGSDRRPSEFSFTVGGQTTDSTPTA